jgi:hypothetical protein
VAVFQRKTNPIVANGNSVKKKCDVGSVFTQFFMKKVMVHRSVVNLGKSVVICSSGGSDRQISFVALKIWSHLDEISEQLIGISCDKGRDE